MTPKEAVEAMNDAYRPPATHAIHSQPCDCDLCLYQSRRVVLDSALASYRSAKPDEAYKVVIHGQYDADSHCVVTSHGEPLVAFETDAGSLAPLDGKAVTVTVRAE